VSGGYPINCLLKDGYETRIEAGVRLPGGGHGGGDEVEVGR
jgi:hypothetical protein